MAKQRLDESQLDFSDLQDGDVTNTSGNIGVIKHNRVAVASPTGNDDSGDGYAIGSIWIYNDVVYIATSVGVGSATWQQIYPTPATSITGILPLANGGLGGLTAGVIPMGNGAGAAVASPITSDGSNRIIFGSASYLVTNLYGGAGRQSATPSAWGVNGTNGLGTNINGGHLDLSPGASTGSGIGGSFRIFTTPASASSAIENTRILALEVDGAGNVGVGTLATAIGAKFQVVGTTRIGVSTSAYADFANNTDGISIIGTSSMGGRVTIGREATVGGATSVGIGYLANASGDGGVAVGGQSNATGLWSTALGYIADAGGSYSLALGTNADAPYNESIAIGPYATTAEDNSCVIGSHNSRIDSIYGGKGYENAVPTGWGLYGTHAVGTDIAGGGIYLLGGYGTGTGNGGPVRFYTAPPSGSSGASRNLPILAMEINGAGNVGIGTLANTIGAKLHVIGTTRLGATSVSYADINVSGTTGISIIGSASSSTAITIGREATIGAGGAIGMGYLASAGGTQSIAIGRQSSASGTSSVALGYLAIASNTGTLALGNDANATVANCMAIGVSSRSNHSESIAIGYGATTNEANTCVFGSNNATINRIYGGKGASNASPTGWGLYGTQGLGTDIIGGNILLAGGRSTGTGAGGNVLFYTAPPGGSSGTSLNAHAIRAIIDTNGNFAINNGSAITAGTVARFVVYDATVQATARFGYNSTNFWDLTVNAAGNMTLATNTGTAISIGKGATIIAAYANSLGFEASAGTQYSIAIGYQAATTVGQGTIAIGRSASASNSGSIGLGYLATAAGIAGVAVGQGADAGGQWATAIGYNAKVSGTDATALGHGAEANFLESMALGAYATCTAANQLVIGSDVAPLNTIYLGRGTSTTATPSITMLVTPGTHATNLLGSGLIIGAGTGVGTGVGGSIQLQTAPASGVSGVNGTLTTRFQITGAGAIGFHGVTPYARPTAYTQTYSTASRTHAALTYTALTDSSAGTAGGTLAALPNPTDTPATADALRDDLVTNVWPVLRNWIASVNAKLAAAVVDLTNLKQVVNSIIDDHQAYGLFQ